MTTSRLAAALRACAAGLCPLEAGAGLLIAHDVFLHRGDFTERFIRSGISITDGATEMAEIDWDAAITALEAGELPAQEANDGFSASRPAWPPACRSISATPSPASTTATSRWRSAPSHTPPASVHPISNHDRFIVQRSYRLLHAAARLTRGSRRRRLQIAATWPWAAAITAAWDRISALPQAP
jgi:hypothetical protein